MNIVLFCITTFVVFYCCIPIQAQSVWPFLLPDHYTCMAARNAYWSLYPDVYGAHLDPVYHFQNGGFSENRIWEGSLCNTNPLWANASVCNCSRAQNTFTAFYTWVHQSNENAFSWWLENTQLQSNGGMVWNCDYCMQDAGITGYISTIGTPSSTTGTGVIVTVPENCTCWQARMKFWYFNFDVYDNDVEPLVFYEIQGANEGRQWMCDACAENPIPKYDPSCNCTAAVERYILSNASDGVTLETAWQTWITNNEAGSDQGWHAELCLPVLQAILQTGTPPPNPTTGSTTSVSSATTSVLSAATSVSSTTTLGDTTQAAATTTQHTTQSATTQAVTGNTTFGGNTTTTAHTSNDDVFDTSAGNRICHSVFLIMAALALIL